MVCSRTCLTVAKWRCDLVLSAVGLRPRTDLAAAAGLAVNRGVMVDRHLQTSHANIYALGDCAEVDGLNLLYVMPLMSLRSGLGANLGRQAYGGQLWADAGDGENPSLPVGGLAATAKYVWRMAR